MESDEKTSCGENREKTKRDGKTSIWKTGWDLVNNTLIFYVSLTADKTLAINIFLCTVHF